MNKLKSFFQKLKLQKKYAASNPANFEEIWSFNATGIQMVSIVLIFVIVIGLIFTFLINNGPFSSYVTKNDVSIERKKLENQYREITALKNKIDEQEAYIKTVSIIISGGTIKDSVEKEIPESALINPQDLNTNSTDNEKELSEKVKNDLRTQATKKKKTNVQFFSPPVKGVISQKFDLLNHPGIDIVSAKDRKVLACLSGTVIYSGFSSNDGFILIIDHSNGYVSVYKHNKTVLKKAGAKIQMNDPIAIVGNTGENSTGPHVHFELWYNQSAVNPEDYMSFE